MKKKRWIPLLLCLCLITALLPAKAMAIHTADMSKDCSNLPPHPILLGQPSAPALSTLYHASNLDWRFVSHMIFYMFQCPSPISSHPHPLPQSPKDCSIHLCLFCCLAYRVIVTFFLNSIRSDQLLSCV